ncbi:MAG: hypothetical protein PHQ46_10735 [Negativicutes bacterium]|nr:hypothetical protein [Negativicutes bacterium]
MFWGNIDISKTKYNTRGAIYISGMRGLGIRSDGSSVYVGNVGSWSRLYLSSVSTPYDISTVSSSNSSNNITNEYLTDFTFSSNGGKLFAAFGGGSIEQFYLSPAWGVNSIGYEKYLDLSPYSSAQSLCFGANGTKLYVVVGGSYNLILQYSLSTAWDIGTASYVANHSSVFTGTNAPYHMAIDDAGKNLFLMDSNGKIYQCSMSTAYDITTLSYTGKNFTASGSAGMCFKPDDGTKLYVLDNINMYVNEYDTVSSIAWTKTLNESLSISESFKKKSVKIFINYIYTYENIAKKRLFHEIINSILSMTSIFSADKSRKLLFFETVSTIEFFGKNIIRSMSEYIAISEDLFQKRLKIIVENIETREEFLASLMRERIFGESFAIIEIFHLKKIKILSDIVYSAENFIHQLYIKIFFTEKFFMFENFYGKLNEINIKFFKKYSNITGNFSRKYTDKTGKFSNKYYVDKIGNFIKKYINI